MTPSAIDRAQKQFEQAKARLIAAKARENAAERKVDTRRKIVLGGALLELAKTNREASALVTKLIEGLTREQDKRIFQKVEEKGVRSEGSAAAKVEAPLAQPARAPASESVAPRPQVSSPTQGYIPSAMRPDTERL